MKGKRATMEVKMDSRQKSEQNILSTSKKRHNSEIIRDNKKKDKSDVANGLEISFFKSLSGKKKEEKRGG